jgi:hypothetical protein
LGNPPPLESAATSGLKLDVAQSSMAKWQEKTGAKDEQADVGLSERLPSPEVNMTETTQAPSLADA